MEIVKVPSQVPMAPRIVFEEPKPRVGKDVRCSVSVCPNGHRSRPSWALADCPRCGSQGIALRMENCPVCNEPALRHQITLQWLPVGRPMVPVCAGEHSLGEQCVLEVDFGLGDGQMAFDFDGHGTLRAASPEEIARAMGEPEADRGLLR